MLLQEMQHRVANSLQIIASILMLKVSLLIRRRTTTTPASSRPTMLQTFLPRSVPSTAIFMIRSSI
jgi:membrane-associated PAP2 superfamily phosphatase